MTYLQYAHFKQIVRGYYTCAYSRFVDTVCQGIQGELFVTCRNDIFKELQDQLGIMEPDGKPPNPAAPMQGLISVSSK